MTARRLLLSFAFVMGLFALDRATGAVLERLARDVTRGTDGLAVANRALRAQAEAFVLGSSRAYRHYDPAVLGAALGVRVHNAGAPGQALPFTRGLCDLILRERSPELLVVHVDATSLVDTGWDARMEVLAPFMDRSPAVRRLILSRSETQRVKYLSRAFRYNNRLAELLSGRGPSGSAGFGPLDQRAGIERLRDRLYPARQGRSEEQRLADPAEPARLEMLREMIRDSREAGAFVVLSTAPRWRPQGRDNPDERRLLGAAAELAREEGVPWIEITLDSHPELRDPDLWADTQHLNREGAERFSRLVAERLVASGIRDRLAAVARR